MTPDAALEVTKIYRVAHSPWGGLLSSFRNFIAGGFLPMIAAVDTSPVEAFIEALKHRNFDSLQCTFAPGIRLRGLTPRAMRDETGAHAARAVVQSWFGDADMFEMQRSSVEVLVDRVHAFYRIRCREDGAWYMVEQHIFAETSDGQITALNALCSGFRPVQ